MKKLLCSLLLVFTFLVGASFSPSPVLAQVSCCEDGKVWRDGDCHTPLTANGCETYADLMCDIGGTGIGLGSIGTGIITGNTNCEEEVEAGCMNAIAAGGNIGCDTLTITADLPQVLFGIPGAQEACEQAFGTGDITGSTFDDACDDDQTCNSNNRCVSLVPFELCKQIPESESAAIAACEACAEVDDVSGAAGVWTALGCIKTAPTEMIATIMRILMGISGGVALLMMLAAGFMFSTSEGDPKKVSEARELMTSAVIGILFVIFSVTILQFIGVTLLRIPGFGG